MRACERSKRSPEAQWPREHEALAATILGQCVIGRQCPALGAAGSGSLTPATGRSSLCLAGDQVLEGGLVPDRIEVGVLLRHVATALPHVGRPAEVLDGVCCSAREALAARHVVVEVRLVGVGLDELEARVGRLRVPAGVVERSRRFPPQFGGVPAGSSRAARPSDDGESRSPIRSARERRVGEGADRDDEADADRPPARPSGRGVTLRLGRLVCPRVLPLRLTVTRCRGLRLASPPLTLGSSVRD